MDFLCLGVGCDLASADGPRTNRHCQTWLSCAASSLESGLPDGLVGNDDLLPFLGGENGCDGIELLGHDVDGLAGLTLLYLLSGPEGYLHV